MYKPTIWQDHIEGVQEGTDMSAANFNNIESGIMEAAALAALNASMLRYNDDMAKNAETVIIEATLTGANTNKTVAIPESATRNMTTYSVVAEIKSVTGGTAGDIIVGTKQTTGFSAKYNGSASSIVVLFHVSGGMF